MLMKVVLMAGGKGTRINSIANDIPKPMIPIEGKPVLEWEIECLKKQGFTDILITISHLGQTIIDYFTHLKIDEAKKLLRKRENNISQVSSILSFDNPNYFSKVFKKVTMMSPSKYRERHNIY